MMKKLISFCILSFFIACNAFADTKPLSADEAFQLTATARDYQTILLQWQIAPGYFLYQKHFSFQAMEPKNVQLATPLFPCCEKSLKTPLGTFAVYADQLTIAVPIIDATQKNILLQVHYQGCSETGYCYPPTAKVVSINLAGNYMQWTKPLDIDVAPSQQVSPQAHSQDPISALLNGKSTWLLLLGFLGFGLLISFTPCILPMIPILSSMIIGQKKITHAHAFLLSLFYVLGMAITYAIAGILFGFIGSSVQTMFQQPWIILVFSLLFVAMALSLFGFYQIQLPERLRSAVANTSRHQKKGTYFGAAAMGCLSTLILSPCVTPPLVAVLGFISQTGNAWLGGGALLVMGIGMGFPLLLIGALGPKVLPHTGPWMNTAKNIMGILMLAMAIFMAQRVLNPTMIMPLWAALSIGTALYFGALSTANTRGQLVKKAIGLLFFIYGVLLIDGAYQGDTSPFQVIQKQSHLPREKAVAFQIVDSVTSAKKAIKSAPLNQIVMLDFHADWCLTCKELEAMTFSNPAVQKQFSQLTLLRADVTQNSPEAQQLMRYFKVVAPPTILFFKNGREIKGTRIAGFINARDFLEKLKRMSIINL